VTREVEYHVKRIVPDHPLPLRDTASSVISTIRRLARWEATWLEIAEDWTERRGAPNGSSWHHDSWVDSHGDAQ
jgi:hypothetical protein